MPKKNIFSKGEVTIAKYYKRTDAREKELMAGTMNFVVYFMDLGDDEATAKDKVGQMSDECEWRLYQYTLGRTQPLIDQINASSLAHMDAAAKAFLVGELTPTV